MHTTYLIVELQRLWIIKWALLLNLIFFFGWGEKHLAEQANIAEAEQ